MSRPGDPVTDDMPDEVRAALAPPPLPSPGFMAPSTDGRQGATPLTVQQVRALFPEWGTSSLFSDTFCQGLAAYAVRMGLRMEPGCFEVSSAVRYTPGPGGVGIAGSVIYEIKESGLAALARRAGIWEGTHQVTSTGPMIATARVYAPMPDGSLRPVDASAAYADWFDRSWDAPFPTDGTMTPVLPGPWETDPEGMLIRMARALAFKAALGDALTGHLTAFDMDRTEKHRRCAAHRAQLAARIAALRGAGVAEGS